MSHRTIEQYIKHLAGNIQFTKHLLTTLPEQAEPVYGSVTLNNSPLLQVHRTLALADSTDSFPITGLALLAPLPQRSVARLGQLSIPYSNSVPQQQHS